MYRFAVVLLVDGHGRLLMQERDEFPEIDPERWGLVGGHVDAGEGFEDAAYRELAEETGIRLERGTLALWRTFEVFHQVYDSLDEVQVWVASTRLADADIVVGEGRQIVFVEPRAVRTLDLTVSAALIVPEFLSSATYRELAG